MGDVARAARVDDAPLRKVRLWQPDIRTDRRPDGTILVHRRRNSVLPRQADGAARPLRHHGGGPGLSCRPRPRWRVAQTHLWRNAGAGEASRRGVAGFRLSAERPLLILSGNDLEHALLGLAAQYVGAAYAPVSPAYSLVSTDFSKLRDIARLLTPGLVFAADGNAYAAAIDAAIAAEVPVIVTANPVAGRKGATFAELAATRPSAAVERAFDAVGPDTIVKFLFTSGSTGSPKAVIVPQRMICANQAMVRDCYAFMQDEPPVVLDWAPWSHTAGGNKVFSMVLNNGGSLYIDDGRPTHDGIGKTVRNLKDVAPTWYFNVPRGYDDLIPHMRADRALRERFFSRLNYMMYAGAGLAQHTWDALEQLAVETTGERVLLAAGLGTTETGPFALMCTTDQRVAGNVGVPARGLVMKLAPVDDKLEVRLKGPSIMPGYWRDPGLTASAFDEEGFYRLGDALRFADPADAAKGFYFDGRIAENFKLTTGTWVGVGELRAGFINHFGAIVRDVVITGLDRDFVGALVFPDIGACRALAAGLPADAATGEVLADARVRRRFAELLTSMGRGSTGSSTLVRRMLLLAEQPSIDRGEMTDKGSVNQRAVLRHRADLVEELYRGSPRVIGLDGNG